MSKLSIGIHADSYAVRLHDDFIWCDLLKNQYDIINYAKSGNSVYQVYRSLLEHENKHDLNIVIIPTYDRFYSKYLYNSKISQIVKENNWFTFYQNVLFYEKMLDRKNQLKDENLDIINSLKVYYRLWADFEYLNDVNMALADKIKNKPKVITIEVKSSDPNNLGLMDISKWDLNNLPGVRESFFNEGGAMAGLDKKKKRWLADDRSCHLSEDNNICLGKVVVNAIEKNMKEIKLSLDDFIVPTKSAENYLKWVYHD